MPTITDKLMFKSNILVQQAITTSTPNVGMSASGKKYFAWNGSDVYYGREGEVVWTNLPAQYTNAGSNNCSDITQNGDTFVLSAAGSGISTYHWNYTTKVYDRQNFTDDTYCYGAAISKDGLFAAVWLKDFGNQHYAYTTDITAGSVTWHTDGEGLIGVLLYVGRPAVTMDNQTIIFSASTVDDDMVQSPNPAYPGNYTTAIEKIRILGTNVAVSELGEYYVITKSNRLYYSTNTLNSDSTAVLATVASTFSEVRFVSDTRFIAANSADGIYACYSNPTYWTRLTYGTPMTAVAASRDLSRVICSSATNIYVLAYPSVPETISPQSGIQARYSIVSDDYTGTVSVAMSSDGMRFAACTQEGNVYWQAGASPWGLKVSLGIVTEGARCLAMTPDGTVFVIVAGSQSYTPGLVYVFKWDGTTYNYTTYDPKFLVDGRSPSSYHAVCISPDGRFCAVDQYVGAEPSAHSYYTTDIRAGTVTWHAYFQPYIAGGGQVGVSNNGQILYGLYIDTDLYNYQVWIPQLGSTDYMTWTNTTTQGWLPALNDNSSATIIAHHNKLIYSTDKLVTYTTPLTASAGSTFNQTRYIGNNQFIAANRIDGVYLSDFRYGPSKWSLKWPINGVCSVAASDYASKIIFCVSVLGANTVYIISNPIPETSSTQFFVSGLDNKLYTLDPSGTILGHT